MKDAITLGVPMSKEAIYKLKKEISELEDDVERLSAMEQAVKIVLNGGYGAIGSPAFRWYDETIAEGITSTGQVAIRYITKKLNEFINLHSGTEGIDYICSSDTDSVYSEIEYIVRRKWPDEKDPSKLTDLIDEFVKTEMDPYIDEMYQELARYMNCDVNLLDMKREGIADTFIIRAKKNYIMKIYDMEGVRFADPYYKFMGVESVRTSTPIMVRTALEDCYKIIIDGTQDELRDYVKKFHNSFIEAPLNKIGSPRGVSDVTKYSTSSHKFIEGVTIPIHVRAAVNYNYLVHTLKLGNKCEYIKNGSKIKFLPLKDPNPIKSHVIGFVDDLPEEFGLSDYIDKEAHFGKVFVSPLESFLIYNGWSIEENALLDLFLDSGIDIVAAAIANKKKPKAKVDIEVESLF